MASLHSVGFELVPHPVPALNDDLAVELGEALCSLYEFIDSQQAFNWTEFAWRSKHCREAGASLAQFHYYLDQFDAGRGYIHGDYHPGNVLFLADIVVGIVDFDYCRPGSRSFDVAYGAATFGTNVRAGRLHEARMKAFVDAYNKMALSLGCQTFVWGEIQRELTVALWLITAWLLERGLFTLYIGRGSSAGE